MDGFGSGARVQVASTSEDLNRFGANSTGIFFFLKPWSSDPFCFNFFLFLSWVDEVGNSEI